MAPRAKIVQQNDVFYIEFLRKNGGVNHPGQIGGRERGC